MMTLRLFEPKVQTVGNIKDFLAESPVKLAGEAMTVGALAGALVATLSRTDMAMAGSLSERIIHAFDPIVEIVQGLSYPVGFIMITAGFLVIMTGNKQKGLHIIKWAALGYVGMQFAPAIMAILVEVGKAMAGK